MLMGVAESSGDNTTTFYTLEVSNSGNLAPCCQEKRPPIQLCCPLQN